MTFIHTLVVLALAAQAFSLPSYGYGPAATKIAGPPAPLEETLEEELPPRDYKFQMEINDGIAGMSQTRTENQKDGVVTGEYSYSRPDGILVKVKYVADKDGFRPEIKEEAQSIRNTGSAYHSMVLPDVPEAIKVSVTEEELKAAHKAEEERAYAAEYPTSSGYATYEAPTTTTTTTTTTRKPYQAPAAAAPSKPARY